jgi:Subtilase family
MLKTYLVHKKTFYRCLAFLSFILIQWQAIAQQNEKIVADSLFKRIADTASTRFTQSRPYYIIQWENEKSGKIKIIRQLTEKVEIVEVNNSVELDLLKQQIRIAPANDLWKYSSFVEQSIKKNNEIHQKFILSGLNTVALVSALDKFKNIMRIVYVDEPSKSVVIKTNSKFVREQLLSLKEIIFIDLRAEPHSETGIIGYNRSFHGLNAVDYNIPGANGKNIVAGVKEQKMEETDLDLHKRVLTSSLAAPAITSHATVISSIIGGAGNSFYDGRGIAYGCKFYPSSFSNLFADDATILNTNKVTVQNHSYGTIIQQFYGAEAVSYDILAWQNKNFVPVFSAGNQGTASAISGPYANIPGYANLTGNFKMAKNIITVGAIDNKGNIPAESSAGPLYDGRLAPQIIALGPNGTSDAAAIVSGTIAVMQQVFADSNSQALPPSSLIKAILYNSAEDVYTKGIDYKTGYGLLNSYASIKAIQQKNYDGSSLVQGQQWTKTITVPADAAQLKITLAWTDSTASVNNNKALTNDLDLEVQEISSGIIYKPWVLNTSVHIDSLAKQPTRKRDSLNTSEQISIALPVAGNYQVKVTGTSISTSSLAFNIAYHTDTLNTLIFTSPQHASDVNRAENENLDIRWKTFVADTNQTGNLYISYNNGTNWQLLKSAHKIYTNYYQWPIKDTSSLAVLKMETSFGDFISKRFIISKVTRLNIDFVCTDSFGLSWNKHVYANGYKIYTLTDSAYLKHILTVADTFTVLNRSAYPSPLYAVEPVLNNGLPAARSIALDITQQGVKCFYKTFYYTLQDQNKLDLILELSAASYVDSIFFEQVTASGDIVQTNGRAKAINTIQLYNHLVNDVPPGTSYWRVKIKLKSGAIVYTEIISVLTTGKRYILFYPNPSGRNNPLTYILQQGVPADSHLQLFDITGRLLKSFNEMPGGTIEISTIAPGIIIYKLVANDNKLLETGKLVVW